MRSEVAESISNERVPLVDLSPAQLEQVERMVPGGGANVQDIYPLTPLQQGILFHHLTGESRDSYVLGALLRLRCRDCLTEFSKALQRVIDRHDALRTAIVWEGLPTPLQVVYGEAWLPQSFTVSIVDEVCEDESALRKRLTGDSSEWELSRAPLVRVQIAREKGTERLLALVQLHALAGDFQSLRTLVTEIVAYMGGRARELPAPASFRDYVTAYPSESISGGAEKFFRERLADVDEPTTPFGLTEPVWDKNRSFVTRTHLDTDIVRQIRRTAKRHGVKETHLFHAAWALVVSLASGRDDPVFSTTLMIEEATQSDRRELFGVTANALPMRLRLRDATAVSLLQQVNTELDELEKHRQATAALAQKCSGVTGRTPLSTALLCFRQIGATDSVGTPDVEVLSLTDIWRGYPVTVIVDEVAEGFMLTAQLAPPVDSKTVLEYFRTALISLVNALETTPSTMALALAFLPNSEHDQIISRFNSAVSPRPTGLIHELFEKEVERDPGALAVMFGREKLTYAQLNGRANQLARALRDRGVGPDTLVGVCLERSLELVVALLGVLKAGGAYVPVDPNYPAPRVRYILEQALPKVILTQHTLRDRLPESQAHVIELDTDWWQVGSRAEHNLDRQMVGVLPRNLAYVIYTSGSTGQPKGAMNEHLPVVNRLQWMQERYNLGNGDRILQKTPFSFDVSVWEFFCPLVSGACLVVARPEGHKDPIYLRDVVEEFGITTLHFVPSMLQSFLNLSLEGRCESARHIVCSGEELSVSLQNRCLDAFPGVLLSNFYGPTETAIEVTAWDCARSEEIARVPIGRPISNVRMYVLDHHRRTVPIGVTGEVYIAGVSVGRGYLGRPDLTAERFVADPFAIIAGSRMYKSGDVGRWRRDGALEYLGRNDHQIKIRGFRIELTEIEKKLASFTSVKDAVVVALEGTEGDKRLVAYVTPRGNHLPTIEELREYSKGVLPEFMVPNAFVILREFPLTQSGKLDRRSLPAPDFGAGAALAYEPPRGGIEVALVELWQELLQVERVGRNDNFFDLGGHSLLGMKLIARLAEQLGTQPSVGTVFQYPTVSHMAELVKKMLLSEDLRNISEDPTEIDEGVI